MCQAVQYISSRRDRLVVCLQRYTCRPLLQHLKMTDMAHWNTEWSVINRASVESICHLQVVIRKALQDPSWLDPTCRWRWQYLCCAMVCHLRLAVLLNLLKIAILEDTRTRKTTFRSPIFFMFWPGLVKMLMFSWQARLDHLRSAWRHLWWSTPLWML